MVFLGNPKNVFWEAFLLTVIVFIFGLFLGYAIENSRVENVNEYYIQSEISLMDILALNNVVSTGNLSCDVLINSNLEFADKIFLEAQVLDRYEGANKLSDSVKLIHKRYDLLRTLLWTSAISAQKQCSDDFSIVVYLYERGTDDLAKRATQNVWSKVLQDFKEQQGNKIILIPISADEDLESLQGMIRQYDIKRFPVVVINGNIVNELTSAEELESYLI